MIGLEPGADVQWKGETESRSAKRLKLEGII